MLNIDRAADHLIQEAYADINTRYGPRSTHPLAYHCLSHTIDAVRASEAIGNKAVANGNLDRHDRGLLPIAAVFHDIVHDLESGNEQASADTAATRMGQINRYTPKDIERVKKGIMATVIRLDGCLIFQAVDPEDYFTQAVADADLSSLGKPPEEYWPRAKNWYVEKHPGVPLEGAVLLDYVDEQVETVREHRFHTEEARAIFCHKDDIIDFLGQLKLAA